MNKQLFLFMLIYSIIYIGGYMLYSSVNNEKIKNIKKLNTKKYRDETNLYLVEGEHLVKEAHENNVLEELILLENTNLNIDVKTSYVTKNVLNFISNLDTPNGILGICKKKENTCCISQQHSNTRRYTRSRKSWNNNKKFSSL